MAIILDLAELVEVFEGILRGIVKMREFSLGN